MSSCAGVHRGEKKKPCSSQKITPERTKQVLHSSSWMATTLSPHMVQSHLSIWLRASRPHGGGGWTCNPLLPLLMLSDPVLSWCSSSSSALIEMLVTRHCGFSWSCWTKVFFFPTQQKPPPCPTLHAQPSLLPVFNSTWFLSPSFAAPHSGVTATPIVWAAALTRYVPAALRQANRAHKGLPLWPYQLGFIRCCAASASPGCSETS